MADTNPPPLANEGDTPLIYENYSRWKGWVGDAPKQISSEKFFLELKRGRVQPGSAILEIGFGHGEFLDWGALNGFRVTGVEIIGDLVSSAARRGHEVYLGNLDQYVQKWRDTFDAVVAFDVFEHLTKGEIAYHLRLISSVLKSGGVLIARTPNGASLAGLRHQYSDPTHQTALTAAAISYLAASSGLVLESSGNAARSYAGGKHAGAGSRKRIAYFCRSVLEIVFGFIYFGERVPLDPDLTFVLRRAP